MEHRFVHDMTVAEMLDDDPLHQRGRDARVPDAFRIHHDHRSAGADAEARCLASFHAARPEQQGLALQQSRKLRVERATLAIR